MSIISISATKAQKDGAKYLFGPKGESILAVLEGLAKAKELRTPHLSGLVLMLKDAEDEELIKFKASPAGKRTIEAAKQLATAKTLVTSIKALRGVKVNSKWIQDHQDVKADVAEETKTHRATGRGGKPQKGNTLVNHQAPEAETISLDDADYPLGDIDAMAGRIESILEEDYGLSNVKVAANQAAVSHGPYFNITVRGVGEGQIYPPHKNRAASKSYKEDEFLLQVNNFEHNDMVYDKYRYKLNFGTKDLAGVIADKFGELWTKSVAGPSTKSRRKDGARMVAVKPARSPKK